MPWVQQRVDRLRIKDQPHLSRLPHVSLVGQAAEQAHVAGDFCFIFRRVEAASLRGKMIEKLAECLLSPAAGELCPERRIHLSGEALPALGFDRRNKVGV
jgi:hypothetical protein